MLARRFLWIIAILIILVIAAALAYRLFGERLITAALVPSAAYVAPPPADGPDYALARNWIARPDLARDPARWTPAGITVAADPENAVFYILPTAIFDRGQWNATLAETADNAPVGQRMAMFLRGQASVFNGVGAIWSPRYRQATFGAFLTDKPEAAQALDLAYGDVLAAFDAFVAAQPADRPIVLAGHSQGSLHLLRLLKERVAGTPLARRIIAVYAGGWPISITADLPALGLPACASPEATGCILAWQSFARPAEFATLRARFDAGTGLAGVPRKDTQILCTNPIIGAVSAAAVPAADNLGSLLPNADFSGGELIARGIGAQCLASGILDIGEPPGGYSAFILPGNNYHVYDYPLFWADLRADVGRRVAAFAATGTSAKPTAKTAAKPTETHR
jgi:hypothetical protein